MIEQELLLLGLLHESPKHGYEIKKQIRQILTLFAGIDLKSVYYPLRVLERKGLVQQKVNREGNRPPRFVYALTPAGVRRFNELLEASFLDFTRPTFSLDICLYFLSQVPAAITRRRLRARVRVLEKLARDLSGMIASARKRNPPALVHILTHNQRMVKTEAEFLTALIADLQRDSSAAAVSTPERAQ
jgi:DNA-binding PadR family transcriptional regulator